MNNLSKADIESLLEDLGEWQGFYTDPADREQYTMFSNAIAAVGELFALRETGKEPVAVVLVEEDTSEPHRVAWTIKGKNLTDGRHELYAAPQLPAVQEGEIAMLSRWVAFGRAVAKSGSTLPRHLIAETEAMIAAAQKPE